MAVRVDQVTKTKSGKGLRVCLSGSWYGSFLDSGLDKQVGNMIEAEIITHEKFGPSIKAWKPVQAAAPQVPPPPAAVPSAAPAVAAPFDERNPPPETYEREPVYATPAPSDNVAPWYWPSVSNICAAAIEKGLIGAPEQLNMWALKWAQVCVATKEQVK